MPELKFGKYWKVARDLRECEVVDVGCRNKERAKQKMKELAPAFRGKIVLLDTVENDLPSDDPKFDASKDFTSKRWCVVVTRGIPNDEKPLGTSLVVIDRLMKYLMSNDCRQRQRAFINFLIQYLVHNKMPGDDEKYAGLTSIDDHFGCIVLDAAVMFRESDTDYAVRYRKEYEKETNQEVPDIYAFSQETSSFIQTNIEFVVDYVFGKRARYIKPKIDSLLSAHYHLLDKIFRRFVQKVWRTGVCEIIKQTNQRGLKGVFSDVTLITWTMCGRTTIQFDKESGESINFVAGEDDYQAYSAGLNFCHADLLTAVKMIETVIENWPSKRDEQIKIFSSDKDVKHWGVAVMEAQNNSEESYRS